MRLALCAVLEHGAGVIVPAVQIRGIVYSNWMG